MKKLLVIAIFFWGHDSLAAENLNNEADVIAYKAAMDIAALPREIYGLLNQRKISDAYTKAVRLETRDDFGALLSKCNLAALLQTFPAEEARQLAKSGGIDKDKPYDQEIVGYSFWDLLVLHHCWICSDDFQLGMQAKKACEFLLARYPDYTYTGRKKTLTFAEIAEIMKNPDNIGRELLGVDDRWFFYPNNEDKMPMIRDWQKREDTCVKIDNAQDSDGPSSEYD